MRSKIFLWYSDCYNDLYLTTLIFMMIFRSSKKSVFSVFLMFTFVFLALQSCKKKRPEMANILYKKTHNKVFNNVTPEGFSEVFKQVIDSVKATHAYPEP